jgi:UDP-2,3-diacylglucosamine hydrolase
VTSGPDIAYFISDAHLGIPFRGHEGREEQLVRFLEKIRTEHASHLFIVGDLFDFWVEYRHAIRPAYFTALHHLRALVDAGTTVHYLAGNHDFALGPFLEKTIGMKIHSDHLELSLQGKTLHLHHGDGLVASDVGYRLLRAVLRNPVLQALYKLLHPNIGVPLANLFSGSSRHILKRRCGERKLKQYRALARRYLAQGSDIVVFAHTHLPELRTFGGKMYCNTGEWIRRYTYAKLESGHLSLWEYFPDRAAQELPMAPEEK